MLLQRIHIFIVFDELIDSIVHSCYLENKNVAQRYFEKEKGIERKKERGRKKEKGKEKERKRDTEEKSVRIPIMSIMSAISTPRR